ncbi:DUF1284 domain-containing protein [Geminicoccus roseus]|uniref:DUF1284 domain-containing protein n=1 Tax=Geminicoccus roseus TaxID=404900 RepID=UPI00040FB853|nr:DUF1284 domain-containing protein [Geminicoccus roseus]
MLTYVGKGYSPAFVARFNELAARLGNGEEILLVSGPDDVCAPLLADQQSHCHRPGVGERDRRAAQAVADLLGRPIAPGERLILDAAGLERMRTAFRGGSIRAACQNCEWSDLCTEVAQSGFTGSRLHAGRMEPAHGTGGKDAWTRTSTPGSGPEAASAGRSDMP